MHYTVCYLTNRKEPMIQWFFDSFHRECSGCYTDVKIVVVDYWAQACDDWTESDVENRLSDFKSKAHCPITHIPPKPTVWQGKHRLTKINYFAASNTRNTGLCTAPDGYIVYVDDISVLLPGWLNEIKAVSSQGRIALGTYDKVLNLVVESGDVKSFTPHPKGQDSRRQHYKATDPFYEATGSWMFGCSVAIPVQALLSINGFDEDADSMSGEDYIAGIMMEKQGYKFAFCPRMKTFESEERHFIEKPFARIIKPTAKGSPYPDSSHVLLDQVIFGQRRIAPNYQNMRDTRDIVLAGNPFPIVKIPEHDWRDGQPLREMEQTR